MVTLCFTFSPIAARADYTILFVGIFPSLPSLKPCFPSIFTLEVEVQDRQGQTKKIKQPHVNPERCTGCGICEHVCPYKDRPAVHVSSANESRHPEKNQPILPEESPY